MFFSFGLLRFSQVTPSLYTKLTNLKKLLILFTALLILASGGIYLYRSYLAGLSPSEVVEHLPEIAKNLEFELDNVRYTHTRSGVKKWELSTHKAKRIKGQGKIILEGVEAWIFSGGKLKNDTHILANQGSYLVKTGDISLSGRIRIVNKDFTITTEHLDYFESRNQIIAYGKLLVKNDSLVIKANRAKIDLKAQLIHFSGGVRTTINLDTLKNGSPALKTSSRARAK